MRIWEDFLHKVGPFLRLVGAKADYLLLLECPQKMWKVAVEVELRKLSEENQRELVDNQKPVRILVKWELGNSGDGGHFGHSPRLLHELKLHMGVRDENGAL